MITSKYNIREQNEALVLKNIITNKNISRAELSVITKLNKASVSSITKTLLEEGLIFETGIGNASIQGGRKPIMLQFNPKVAAILSFDIGTDYLKGLLSYLDGEEINFIEIEQVDIHSKNIVALIENTVKKLIEGLSLDIIGLSLAVQGIVKDNSIIFTPYYDLDKIDLYNILNDIYNFPIYIENEANLSSLGEYVFSIDSELLISLSIYKGIGAGIVERGVLQKGLQGKAGEIGHSILYPNGKPCPCGNKGCLEQYASSTAFYELIESKKHLKKINSKIIKSFIEVNDTETINELKMNAFLLSIGINNIISLYDPDVVVINSSLFRLKPDLLSIIKQNLTEHISKSITIQNSKLGPKAILYGGVALCCQNYLNINELDFRL